MIARRIWACRPTSTPSSSTESSIVVAPMDVHPGVKDELVTVAPLMTTPGDTAELWASPNFLRAVDELRRRVGPMKSV